MLRIRAWMCARLLPGVRWWRSMMRNKSLSSLISIPFRSRVAWMEKAIGVLTCNRRPPGPAAIDRATMPTVAFNRWDPLRDLVALDEQIGQLVGTDAPGWTPPVDLYETAGEFVLTAELPGLKRDQVEIHVEDARIVIRGARGESADRDIPCEHYHRDRK